MATRLIQILSFANVGAGATLILTHDINVDDVPQAPDFVAPDNGGFSIVVTPFTVQVTNNNTAVASVNVWLELKHTTPRELGAAQTVSLVPRPFVTSGGGAGTGDLGWYGTAVDGNFTAPVGTYELGTDTPGDVFYNNLTIPAGCTFRTGGLTNGNWRLFVAGRLTIEAGGLLINSGADAAGVTAGVGVPNNGNCGGGYSGGDGSAGDSVGAAGTQATEFPPREATGRQGGDGGASSGHAGGAGGPAGNAGGAFTLPYTIDSIVVGSANALSAQTTGGAGGGGGAAGVGSTGGGGGAGGGVMIIVARHITAPDNAIRSVGGIGAAGTGADGGGGGGGMGGVVLIVTDDSTLPVMDVSGGAAGAGAGTGVAGVAGSSGVVIGISPIAGPL